MHKDCLQMHMKGDLQLAQRYAGANNVKREDYMRTEVKIGARRTTVRYEIKYDSYSEKTLP